MAQTQQKLAATPAFNPETADQALDITLAIAGLKDGAARQAFRDGPAAGGVKRALEFARTQLVALFGEVDTIRADRRRTPYGQAADARDAIRRGFGSIKGSLDQEFNALVEARQRLGVAIDEALAPAARTCEAAEIRGHFASLPDADRFKLLEERVEAGDAETVHAVLSAPPFLSGLSDTQRAALRAQAEQRFAPELVARRAGLDALEGSLKGAAAELVRLETSALHPERLQPADREPGIHVAEVA